MRNFILGTDWWSDCDDAVAVRLLCRKAKAGEIGLLGIVINGCMEYSVPSMDGMLCREGMGEIPVGIDREGTDFAGLELATYQKRLSQYAVRRLNNDAAEDGVRLYRRLLAEAKEPAEIIEIGFLQAVAALLESGPDDISPLNGAELVKEKVRKFWVMAGRWDVQVGLEHNFHNNSRSRKGGSVFCEKCPVPVTFLGFEAGASVITGDNLSKDDLLAQVLSDYGTPDGRCSWDPMTAMLAVIGDEEAAGYGTVRGTAFVDAESGENRFSEDPQGLHRFVVKKRDDDFYKNMINNIIM